MQVPYKLYVHEQAEVIIKGLESLIIGVFFWALSSIDISTGTMEFGFLMSRSQRWAVSGDRWGWD